MHALLRQKWGSGTISSVEVQQWADAALSTGSRDMERFQKIANKGAASCRSNAQRDLMRALGRPRGAPAPYRSQIPIRSKDGGIAVVDHPFFLPHACFAAMHEGRPDLFARQVTGDDSLRAQFWKSPQAKAALRHHPVLRGPLLPKTVPLGLHGDAGKFSHHDSLFVITWNALLATGTSQEQRHVITVIRKSQLLETGATLEAIFNVIAWSFNALLRGACPDEDECGMPMAGSSHPLADGWRGALLQIRGDWQFYVQAFGFPQWNSSDRMCWLCRASSTRRDYLWTDMNRDAGWRATCWSHEEYVRHLAERGQETPNLFLAEGLRVEFVMVDVLHAVDLGVSSHVVGNIIWELLPRLGANRALQLKELDRRLKEWGRTTQSANRLQGDITEERIKTSGGWPKFKSKAAPAKHLKKFVLGLLLDCVGACDDLHHRRRVRCAELMSRFYDIIDEEGRFLSAASETELAALGNEFGLVYASLHAEAAAAGKRLWKLVPKMHLFIHLTTQQVRYAGNPRFFWTYGDEDMVGQLVEVAQSCHPLTMAETALFKYSVLKFG